MFGHTLLGRLGIRRMLGSRGRAQREAALPDPQLTRRRPLYVVAALLLAASVITQYSLLFICGLLALGIAVAPEVWYRFGLRGLTVRHDLPGSRIAFGDVAPVTLTVENRSLLPLPLLRTEDDFPEALTVLGARLGVSSRAGTVTLARSLRLWVYQRVRRRYFVRGVQRGAYVIGPTVTQVSDPFGLLTRQASFDTARVLLVHPLVAPLERLGLEPRALFGEHESRLRLLEDPLRVAGIRDYVPGDDPRRVHWKATARLGSLQSKVLDPSTQRTLLIALDIRTFNRAQMGYDPELAEYTVTVAASVAAWAISHGYAVGLVANGVQSLIAPDREGRPEPAPRSHILSLETPRLRLRPSSRPEQLTLILDSLARVSLFGGALMGPLIAAESRMAPSGSSIVYVGLESLVDAKALMALRQAQQSGHAVSLVMTTREEGDSVAGEEAAHHLRTVGLPITYVGGRRRWQALRADALGAAPTRNATALPTSEQRSAEQRLIDSARRALDHAHAQV
jgi:uncharacterized protein (DUF58 family)